MRTLFQAFWKGKSKVVAKWLKIIPPDQRKEIVNTVKYKTMFSGSYTALQYAAKYNRPKIARLLLDAGAGESDYCRIYY